MLTQTVVQDMQPALIGIALGLAGALALSRVLSGILFAVQPTDPLTYAVVVVLLCGTAVVSCYVPARRAASVDPAMALREE